MSNISSLTVYQKFVEPIYILNLSLQYHIHTSLNTLIFSMSILECNAHTTLILLKGKISIIQVYVRKCSPK